MNSILELIFAIKKKPALYISRNSISCLKAFLDGWIYREIDTVVDIDVIGDFQDWIVVKYKISTSHSWADILLFYSTDEYKALQKFFEEFELFLAKRKG